MSRTYLFWDIDGTLLDTARAGIFAWEEAIREVLGDEPDMATMQTAGLTDAEIALNRRRPRPRRPGQGRRPAAQLRREPARASGLAPGPRAAQRAREPRGAVPARRRGQHAADRQRGRRRAAKLRHYGLWDFFGAGGAFSIEGHDRPSIAREARRLAGEHGGQAPSAQQMVVIGDTPHDISCGRAIGARTLAVATGPGYDLGQLRACDPWMAVEQLPGPQRFAALLNVKLP